MPGLVRFAEWFGYQLGRLLAWPLDRAMRLEVGELPMVDTREESEMTQYAIQCFGGPKDGHDEILIRDRRPEVIYVWESKDDQRMSKVEGTEAHDALRSRLGTLAYRFEKVVAKEDKPDYKEYRYRYCPKRNKKAEGPADKPASHPKS